MAKGQREVEERNDTGLLSLMRRLLRIYAKKRGKLLMLCQRDSGTGGWLKLHLKRAFFRLSRLQLLEIPNLITI